MCTTNVRINYGFIFSKSLNSPNLNISWANMWCPDYQNKKPNLRMLNSFKGFHLCMKQVIMWYPDNPLTTIGSLVTHKLWRAVSSPFLCYESGIKLIGYCKVRSFIKGYLFIQFGIMTYDNFCQLMTNFSLIIQPVHFQY